MDKQVGQQMLLTLENTGLTCMKEWAFRESPNVNVATDVGRSVPLH